MKNDYLLESMVYICTNLHNYRSASVLHAYNEIPDVSFVPWNTAGCLEFHRSVRSLEELISQQINTEKQRPSTKHIKN